MPDLLITGAAGKTGRAIIAALAGRGATVRALVRRQAQAAAVREAGAAEVVVADLRDHAALRRAAAGVDAIYHICPNMHPEEVVIGEGVIAAAQAAGLSHFVYHSVLHPQTEAMPHHWAKLRVEERLLAASLPFTILQPTAYMQNLLANWTKIQDEGRHATPYPASAAISLVDLADVAAVATRVLQEPGHAGAIYELAGPPLTQTAVAEALARHLGRPVAAAEIPLDDWEAAARRDGALSDYAVATLRQMFAYYARHGLEGNPFVLEALLGRPATTLAAFLARERP